MAPQHTLWPINPTSAPLTVPIFDISQPGQLRRDQILGARTWRLNRPVLRVDTNPRGQKPPLPSYTSVAIEGWVPSSCNRLLTTMSVDSSWMLKRQEEFRAAHNDPDVLLAHECDPNKHYAKWAGGYVDVTDELIARSVCPADLLQYPCRFDELPGGCTMVRLCKQLERYTAHVCPDAGHRAVEYEGFEPSRCGHIHWEIEPSCRFVVGINKECDMIVKKGFECAAGHDLAAGRKVSRCRFEAHIRDGLNAGACAGVKRKMMLLSHALDLEMPRGANDAGMPKLRY